MVAGGESLVTMMKQRAFRVVSIYSCFVWRAGALLLDSHIILKKSCRTHGILKLRLVLLLHAVAAGLGVASASITVAIVARIHHWVAILLIDQQIIHHLRAEWKLSDRAEVGHLLGLRWRTIGDVRAMRWEHPVVSC